MAPKKPLANTPQRLQQDARSIMGSPMAAATTSRANIMSRQSIQALEPTSEEMTAPASLATHGSFSAIDPLGATSNDAHQVSSSGLSPLLPGANRATQRQPADSITTRRLPAANVRIIDLTEDPNEYADDADGDGDDGNEEDKGREHVEGERDLQQERSESAPLHDTNDFAPEDTLTDSDVSSVASEDEYNVPDVIREAEQDAENHQQQNPNAGRPIQLSRRYKVFLKALCMETTTEAADQHTHNGLPYAIRAAKSFGLGQDMRDNEPFDKYAFALIVHVWQVVCLRLLQGVDPTESPSESLITYTGAYFLSAHALVTARCAMAISELKFAVKYWEDRLRQQGGNNP